MQLLNQELVTRSKEDLKLYTPQRVKTLTEEIVQLPPEYALAELNHPSPPSGKLMEERLRAIQGKYALPRDTTNTPAVWHGQLGSTPVYLTAYEIFRGGVGSPDSKAVLQAYIRRQGRYILASQAGGEFDRHGLFVIPITARRENELWYLCHGVRFGDSHSTL